MMELELSDRVINLPESVGDLTLRKYFEIAKLIEGLPSDNLELYFSTTEGQLKLFDLIEVFVENSDDILMNDIQVVTERIISIVNGFSLPTNVEKVIEVEGVKYATRTLKDMNDLTNGEYISLKIYQERFNGVVYDFAPYLLAILIRPCTEEKDEETGEIIYIQSKFDKKDIGNLEWRAKLFLDNVKAKDLMPVLNFFLTTNKTI